MSQPTLLELLGVTKPQGAPSPQRLFTDSPVLAKEFAEAGDKMVDYLSGRGPAYIRTGERATTVELIAAFKAGHLGKEIPEPTVGPTVTPFTEQEEQAFNRRGYFPSGHRYEFTELWYTLLDEEHDANDLGLWTVAQNGLRFEFASHSNETPDYDKCRNAVLVAYERYKLVYAEAKRLGIR